MPDAIETLTAAVAAGNKAAVETFYREYFDHLYQLARRATRRDEAFCLDIVQESVLKIIRSIKPVKTHAQLNAWLSLVVRTTAYDLLRSESRRAKRELAFAATTPTQFTPDLPDEPAHQTLARLKSEIEKLDHELLRIIELRYHQGWTLVRIGNLLGLKSGAIDGRLRRALKHLKSQTTTPNE